MDKAIFHASRPILYSTSTPGLSYLLSTQREFYFDCTSVDSLIIFREFLFLLF